MSMRLMRFKDGKKKALTLSYDDGVRQDIRLTEIMKKYSLKGTFNLNSALFSDENDTSNGRIKRLTRKEAYSLYKDSGNEVAIHGYTHPHLEKLSLNHAMYEITEDRKQLEELFGTLVRGCAYPCGYYNDNVVDILRLCEIKYARTVESTEKFDIPTDWLRMGATCHHKNPRLFELADEFLNAETIRAPYLFYLWGHSYEFDLDDNWDVIERFGEKMGNRDDIWYATNIEIYDYVQAYNSLQTSVNGKMIYNPTLLDLWMEDNGKEICIRSGETVITEN